MTKKQHDQLILDRLRAARESKRVAAGRCEGAKPYGTLSGEAAILAQIQQSRTAGATLQSIADALNKRGVRPRRGERWHAKTIARIAARTGVTPAENQSLWLPLVKAKPESNEGVKSKARARVPMRRRRGPLPEPPPFIPFGYDLARNRKSDLAFGTLIDESGKRTLRGYQIIEDWEEQDIIRRILYLRDVEGKRYREIAALLAN